MRNSKGFTTNYIGAPGLFAIAAAAQDRVEGLGDRQRCPANEGTIALIFAAIATEAFINELPGVLSHLVTYEPRLAAFVAVLNELAEVHATTKAKFLAALTILSGAPFDKSGQSFQDFELLMAARNALAHRKAEFISDFTPRGAAENYRKLLRKLEARRVLGDLWGKDAIGGHDFIGLTNTPAAARWACATAVATTQALLAALELIGPHYRDAATPLVLNLP